MADDPRSDRLSEILTTAEHKNISLAVEMLLRLDELERRGLSPGEMAETMAISGFRPPGGGTWTAKTVMDLTGMVEAEAEKRPPEHLPERSQPTDSGHSDRAQTSPAPVPQPTVRPGPREPRELRAPVTLTGALPTEAANGGGVQARSAGAAALGHRSGDYDIGPLPGIEDESSWLGSRTLALGLIVLMVLAVTAFGITAVSDRRSGDETGSAEGDESPGPAGPQTEADLTASTVDGPADAGDPANPEDMMSIRIEAEDPAGTDGETELSAATATVKADGLLHLEGAFPSQEEADRFIVGLAEVFGRDNIVETYSVDPAAPLPSVSDVSLDKPVLFESGTASIDPSYYSFLEACGDVLRLHPHITMSIAAFTDSVGEDQFNLELSQQRALAIYDFYRELDIDGAQLLSVGYGENDPVADNATEQGREQNRRAILQLLDVMADRSETDS